MKISKLIKELSLPMLITLMVFSCSNKKFPPNIILVLTDDQGWTDSSVRMLSNREDSKSDFYETPNLERLAKDGMVFSNAYAPAPVCTPTRYSILYGKTPAKLKHATLKNWHATPEKETSLPRMIKSVNPNYKTAHFGKWHQLLTPSDVGYDTSDGPTGNFEGDWVSPGVKNPDNDPKRTFGISGRACDFITDQVSNKTPFFMQVSYYAVHVQNYGLESTKEKYRNKKPGEKSTPRDFELPPPPLNQGMVSYAAMLDDLDSGFGMILDKIDELGIAENTYVIFTSDNGGGFRGNEPLKMGKADLWEGGIRVPTVVRGPNVLSGSYCNVPIVGWDFFPTVSEIIGNPEKLSSEFDGGSLVSVFENGNSGTVTRNTEALIFHFPWFSGEPESAIRLGNYKLIKNIDTRKTWLFDVVNDIEESKDLSSEMPEKANKLEEILTRYLEKNDAEHVMDLRVKRRKIMVDQAIPEQERIIIEIKSKIKDADENETDDLELELAKTKKYLNWLRSQVIFTDERSKLHEKT
tara:strand:- start:723 stop:2288 length:1566 start_codon:yes stop_codon:yes gene_type:complete